MIMVLALWVLAAGLVGFRIGKWSERRQAERRRTKVSIPPAAIFNPSKFEKAVPRPADAKMAEIAEEMRRISDKAISNPPRRAWPWPKGFE